MIGEQLRIGPARMEVRLQDWPDGNPGVWVQIGDNGFLFTIEGAARLRDALNNHVSLAAETDEAMANAKPTG